MIAFMSFFTGSQLSYWRCCSRYLSRVPSYQAQTRLLKLSKNRLLSWLPGCSVFHSKSNYVTMLTSKDLFPPSNDHINASKNNNVRKRKSVKSMNAHHQHERMLPWAVTYNLHKDIFENDHYREFIFNQSGILSNSTSSSHTVGDADLSNMSNLELKQSLINQAQSQYSERRNQILGLFVNEYCQRINSFSLGDHLFIAHVFLSCQYNAMEYIKVLLQHLDTNWAELDITARYFNQLSYVIAVHGHCGSDLLSKMEFYLADNLREFNLKEIGLSCLAFFRMQRAFHSYALMDGIAEMVLKDWTQIHLQTLNNIFKQFRYSGYITPSFYNRLGDDMAMKYANEEINDISSDIMHIIRLYASARMFNDSLVATAHDQLKNLLRRDSQNVSSSLQKHRGKDIAKMLWGFASFGFEVDPEIIDCLIKDVAQRVESGEVERFPEILVEVLLALAYLGHYPESLLQCLFTKKMIDAVWSHPLKSKKEEVVVIYESSLIEKPSFNLDSPSHQYFSHMTSKRPIRRQGDMELELKKRMGFKGVYDSLQRLMPGHEVKCTYILPHFHTPSITVQRRDASDLRRSGMKKMNSNKQPIGGGSVLAQLLAERSSKSQEHAPWILSEGSSEKVEFLPCLGGARVGQKRIAIEVQGFNQFTSSQSRLLGLHRMKLRLIRKYGYDVVVIPPAVARQLYRMTSSQLDEYMRENVLIHLPD